MSPFSQMRQRRHRKVTRLVRPHTASARPNRVGPRCSGPGLGSRDLHPVHHPQLSSDNWPRVPAGCSGQTEGRGGWAGVTTPLCRWGDQGPAGQSSEPRAAQGVNRQQKRPVWSAHALPNTSLAAAWVMGPLSPAFRGGGNGYSAERGVGARSGTQASCDLVRTGWGVGLWGPPAPLPATWTWGQPGPAATAALSVLWGQD